MVDLVHKHPSGGYILEELRVGMIAEKVIHATEERIRLFAEASDDFNPGADGTDIGLFAGKRNDLEQSRTATVHLGC